MTLVEFLLARIAEDEPLARAQLAAGRQHGTSWDYNDPRRCLAECEAKRRIVAMHSPHAELCYWSHDSSAVHDDEPCLTLLLLAQPYTDHPDYDKAWTSG
jgi:hypothetical protein